MLNLVVLGIEQGLIDEGLEDHISMGELIKDVKEKRYQQMNPTEEKKVIF